MKFPEILMFIIVEWFQIYVVIIFGELYFLWKSCMNYGALTWMNLFRLRISPDVCPPKIYLHT